MSVAPFLVGVVTSGTLCFLILEEITDRRLFSYPKSSQDKIRADIYNQV